MTVANELELLMNTKADIASAITEKGVEVPAGTPFSGYGEYIRRIGDKYSPQTDWGIVFTVTYPDGKEITQRDYESVMNITSINLAKQQSIYHFSFGNVARDDIIGFEFGRKPTSTPKCFLSYCKNINMAINVPKNITKISDYFMYSCDNYNQPIVIQDGVTNIGYSFCEMDKKFNAPLVLSRNITNIVGDFLASCDNYNCQIFLPPKLENIGGQFMQNCVNYTQPLTLPASIRTISQYNFMYGMESFTGPLMLECSASVIQEGNLVLTTYAYGNEVPKCYSSGITIKGTYAQEWKNKFPDMPFLSSGANCRKLILAN